MRLKEGSRTRWCNRAKRLQRWEPRLPPPRGVELERNSLEISFVVRRQGREEGTGVGGRKRARAARVSNHRQTCHLVRALASRRVVPARNGVSHGLCLAEKGTDAQQLEPNKGTHSRKRKPV